ncbi:MAG: hypothetical protein ACJAS9_000709 [Polaribacter sp.]|jgi:hypothetical protein
MLKNSILKMIVTFLVLSSLSLDLFAKRKKQYFHEASFEVDFQVTHQIIPFEIIGEENKKIVIIGVENNIKQEEEKIGNNNAIVAIYKKKNGGLTYELQNKIAFPHSTIAFDILKLQSEKNVILLLSSTQLSTLDIETGNIDKLADIDSIYLQDKPQFIARKKLVKDINGDGIDDIVIPSFKYLNVLVQHKEAKELLDKKIIDDFSISQLPISAFVDMSSSQISFSEQNYFSQDANFDGLNDFLFVENGKLTGFMQKEQGLFSESSTLIELPFEFSGLPWWLVRGADGETADQSDLKHRLLEDIQDINGDGVLDIMVKKTVSSGVLDREISYDFFFGFEKNGVLSFDLEANTNISAEGTLSNLKLIDMNLDNKKEVLVSSFDIGVSQIIGALLSGSIDQDVFVFSLDENNSFGEEPIFEEEVSLSFSLSSGQSGQPVILTMDSDGNKRKDIILSVGEKRLNVFHGLGKTDESEKLFISKSKRHKTKLPADGNMVISNDLNQDGKDEIIMRYGKQDDIELKNKIVILTAK